MCDVLMSGALVVGNEVLRSVTAKPDGEPDELFAKPVHGLLVHVGLGDELREGDWPGQVSESVFPPLLARLGQAG